MASPNQITVSQLMRLIGTPDCPILLDVCIDEDFAADPRLIPGAKRYPFDQISDVVSSLAAKKVVVICQRGKKLSAGVSALLRAEGIDAEYLEGGNFAWRDAGAPLLPAFTQSSTSFQEATLWVTRHRPKIDRVACPWLIRRFVDRDAKFMFVAPDDVELVAEKFGAIPFDIADAHFGHRGEYCTFDTMLSEFELEIAPLKILSQIVRGADTNQPELSKQSDGLLAMSLGLSRMYKDDLCQMEAGFLFYDALFRWARDASNETHECA